MANYCPICRSPASKQANGFLFHIDCKRCGRFTSNIQIDRLLEATRFNESEIGKISGWIRENQGVQIEEIETLRSLRMPAVGEKTEKLMLYMAKETEFPSAQVVINDINPFIGVSWSANKEELNYLWNEYLIKAKGYLIDAKCAGGPLVYIITPKGWDYIDSFRSLNPTSKIVFVAMRFKKELIDTIYKKAIKPAIEECGYESKNMWDHDHIDKIDDEIIALIKRSKFIVADFTEQNQGAYYEAGFARGLGLKVISTCDKVEVDKLHFDTRQYRTILWEKDNIDKFREELKSCIEANIGLVS